MLGALLEAGAPAGVAVEGGATALHAAAEAGSLAAVLALLQARAVCCSLLASCPPGASRPPLIGLRRLHSSLWGGGAGLLSLYQRTRPSPFVRSVHAETSLGRPAERMTSQHSPGPHRLSQGLHSRTRGEQEAFLGVRHSGDGFEVADAFKP